MLTRYEDTSSPRTSRTRARATDSYASRGPRRSSGRSSRSGGRRRGRLAQRLGGRRARSKELPIDLRGIIPAKQERVTPISQYMVAAIFARSPARRTDPDRLGGGITHRRRGRRHRRVRLALGDKLNLKVVGIYEAGIPPVDNTRVYVTLRNAQTLLGKPDVVGRLEVKLVDTDRAEAVSAESSGCSATTPRAGRRRTRIFSASSRCRTRSSISWSAPSSRRRLRDPRHPDHDRAAETRDIAILRSVGFRRSDILFAFLLQGVIIASSALPSGRPGAPGDPRALEAEDAHGGAREERVLPRLRRPEVLLLRLRLRARRGRLREPHSGDPRVAGRAGRRAPGQLG